MSLFHARSMTMPTAAELIPQRSTAVTRGRALITNDTALRHSAVWACLRLRANLISTLPIDVYRKVLGVQVEVTKPPVLLNPGGERVDSLEWRYSSQIDLDRAGNTVGLITETDRYGLPARIDLQAIADVSMRIKGNEIIKYQIGSQSYMPAEVWHEKQYTVAGSPIGLSPIAYAAWSIGEYLSIQDFALDWFGKGTIPSGELKNTARKITPVEADVARQQFQQTVQSGDMWAHGSDWEFKPIQAENAGSSWLEAKQYGIADIARFFDVPGDLIDAEISTGNVTYANITQRNLQHLINHLGPAIIRRETALSRLTPRPQYVKLNTDALLRMDPAARALMIQTQIASRVLAPSEARLIEDRQPFTESQLAEFDRLFGSPAAKPAPPVAIK